MLNCQIQIHPQPFSIFGISYTSLGPVIYIEPEFVESVCEVKEREQWIIKTVSGELFAITTDEFLKYEKVLM